MLNCGKLPPSVTRGDHPNIVPDSPVDRGECLDQEDHDQLVTLIDSLQLELDLVNSEISQLQLDIAEKIDAMAHAPNNTVLLKHQSKLAELQASLVEKESEKVELNGDLALQQENLNIPVCD